MTFQSLQCSAVVHHTVFVAVSHCTSSLLPGLLAWKSSENCWFCLCCPFFFLLLTLWTFMPSSKLSHFLCLLTLLSLCSRQRQERKLQSFPCGQHNMSFPCWGKGSWILLCFWRKVSFLYWVNTIFRKTSPNHEGICKTLVAKKEPLTPVCQASSPTNNDALTPELF